MLSSSKPDRIKVAISRLRHAYPSTSCAISGHACDLNDEDNLESNIASLFDAATSNGSQKLDHVIFTAGDPLAIKPIHAIDFKYIKQAGMVRFFAPLLIAKHAAKHLSPGPASSITLTTGAVAEHPLPNWSVVGSYASGLLGMTRQLALDLKPVRVNIISPGAVDTELWDHFPADVKAESMKASAQGCATGRVGRPEDVAEAYMYAIKDQNITGSIISTNGGSLIM